MHYMQSQFCIGKLLPEHADEVNDLLKTKNSITIIRFLTCLYCQFSHLFMKINDDREKTKADSHKEFSICRCERIN